MTPKSICEEYVTTCVVTSDTSAVVEKRKEQFEEKYTQQDIRWRISIRDVHHEEEHNRYLIFGWWIEETKGWFSTKTDRTKYMVDVYVADDGKLAELKRGRHIFAHGGIVGLEFHDSYHDSWHGEDHTFTMTITVAGGYDFADEKK